MMFFVAKDDGSREHYFSVTYAEHNQLKDQAAVNRAHLKEMLAAQQDSLLAATAAEVSADKTAPEAMAPLPNKDAKISETDARPVAVTLKTASAKEELKKPVPAKDPVRPPR
jgi:hypothetical protein